jgi:hypothetical protein
MSVWNYGTMWRGIAEADPTRPAQIFGDVTIVGAKALGAAKASTLGVGKLSNADAVAKAAEDITKAQYGVNNRFTKVIKDFTDNNSAYAISHPMVKSSSNPGLLAHLLGDSIDLDETALILRSAVGDPKALDDLRINRAYLSDALEAERGKLSAVDEFKLFAAPDGSGMLPFLNDDINVGKEALENYRSLVYSCLILLWINPLFLFSLSFQLSVLATLGLIVSSSKNLSKKRFI